jgi:hypothetical protein
MSLEGVPFVGLKGPLNGAIVCSTAQGQPVVGLLHIPPSSGTFQPHMTDARVGSLEATTPDGITALACSAVVQPPFTVLQKADPFPDLLGCLAISRLAATRLGLRTRVCTLVAWGRERRDSTPP